MKLKLKGKALKLTGLHERPYERIAIKLDGRKGRILRNPKAKGTVRFAATVGIPGTQAVKLASGVKVKG